jgi:FecR protein
MKRREFMIFIASASAWLLPWVRPARAQNPTQSHQAIAGQAAGPVGLVATLKGSATVTRADAADIIPLQVNRSIFKNDILATGPNSWLGVTFDDETTFSLSPNTRVTVNAFVYQEGGKANAASFNLALGTASFVANLVAKSGDMKITTPVATLGVRGTTGVVDVPQAGASGLSEHRIKLYADEDGHVGRIEVFNSQGASLGTLTEGASAFSLRPGPGGQLQAVPFPIPPQEAARDRGLLRRLFASHTIGRRTIQRQRGRGTHQQRSNPRQPSHHHPRGGPSRPHRD